MIRVPLGFGELHTIVARSMTEAAPKLVQAIGLSQPNQPGRKAMGGEATSPRDTVSTSGNGADVSPTTMPPTLSLASLDDAAIEALVAEGSKEVDEKSLREALSSLKEQLEKIKRDGFSILLVGRAGVGKSSTINKLLEKDLAKVGNYESTTKEVTYYHGLAEGVQFTIYDTPGLCDAPQAKTNDFKYLELIRNNVRRIDVLLFVTPLHETRVRSDEENGIRLLYEDLGPEIWKHSVIVFTFSNYIPKARFAEAKEKRAELLRNSIGAHIGMSEANNIPAVFIDNEGDELPDGEQWRGLFYVTVVERMKQRGHAAFEIMTKPYSQPSYHFTPELAQRYEAAVAPSRQSFWGGVKTAVSDGWSWVKSKLGW